MSSASAIYSATQGDWQHAGQSVADAAVGTLMIIGGPVGLIFGSAYFIGRHFGGDIYDWLPGT